MSTTEASELVEALAAYDTCTISDAAERVGVTGVLTGLHRQTTAKRVAGVAVTVQLGPAGAGTPAFHLGAKAIEAGDDHTVIVVGGGSTQCAGWGGLLARAAGAKGVRGVVVDGLVRDVDEAQELGFPMFSKGVTPVTARRRLVEVSSQEPVTIAGVTVASGDFVLADGSGVVAIAAADIERVLEAADQIARREAAMVARLDQGDPPSQVMDRTYETMVEGKG
jgi:4-hydroxy-4-methyl-2-oxoglutarate aldolase